jgi:multidrug efflux pump subunit AcrA (membrane-fusion protein)
MVDGQQSIVIRQWAMGYRLLTSMLLLIILFACTQNKEHASHDQYTCPMHPTVLQDKPGSCPVCGMDLVKKGQPGEEVKITAELNYLLKPTNAIVTSSIKTISPVQKSMNVETKSNGIITYDTRRFTSLPIRFGGRIEKLLVKYNFQPIRKGQKILEIYSPELLTAQRDLLYLLKSDKDNPQIIEGAKEKLRLLGLSDSQISQLATTSQENYSFAVYSPVDGYIVEEAVVNSLTPTDAAPSAAMNSGMATSNSNAKQAPTRSSGGELLIREGMYVSTGQIIFKIVNTEQVWAEFDVYQRDAAFINENDPVHLTFDNTSEEVEANVNFIQPIFKNGESFVKVRVYLSNPANKFRIGQLVKAQFSIPSKNTLWIPVSARLDLGTKEIAFTKRRGVFRPKEIVTSRQSGDWIEVMSGLEVSDSVAYHAQFMIDSESFIKVRN